MREHKHDAAQARVIAAHDGTFVCLAPPGCGKTYVLAERVKSALDRGVPPEDMLCLTFTNRAARSMKERIQHTLRSNHTEEYCRDIDKRLFVGNVHRICSRLLVSEALLPADTSIIDDDDVISIICQFWDEDEETVKTISRRRRNCFTAMHLADMMQQIELGQPREMRIHPECLTTDDIKALKNICDTQRMPLTPATMAHIYHHAADYQTIVKGKEYPSQWQPAMTALLNKMETALFYSQYKTQQRLIDFEDLLILAYQALAHETTQHPLPHFTWVQVDEVQDLNTLQIAIINLLTDDHNKHTIMFLGDKQQAIYSFMGAKQDNIDNIIQQAQDNIFKLNTNHRSPQYLLDVFNTYAQQMFNIPREQLPLTETDEPTIGDTLQVRGSKTVNREVIDVARQAQAWTEKEEGTTGILVLTNNDADMISACMDELGIEHFKVSGTDLFAIPEVKLLLAHLSVYANAHNFLAWSRLLKGLHIYERNASARTFVGQLSDHALTPLDLLLRPGSSYLEAFMQAYEGQEIVVFDTETTGLNIFEDDIIQIAAVKIRQGTIVEGSTFSVYIETECQIPTLLGTIVNPIIEERKHQKLLSHEAALSLFMDYVGTDILLGHNADYDYAILDENLRRYLPSRDLRSQAPIYYDSLALSHLISPQLPQYKLKYLLETFHLEGENSHLADADVAATVSLVRYCYARCQELLPAQKAYLASRTVRQRAAQLRERYLPIYRATLSRLRTRQSDGEALVSKEMRALYSYLVKEGVIMPVPHIEYVFKYISQEIIEPYEDRDLYTQITRHIFELGTLRESDLCTTDIVEEKIFVATIHKAKGLEFDNVIVFDANDDRYPSAYTATNPVAVEEDCRKFYVALTRARQRLQLAVSAVRFDYHNRPIDRCITRFIKPIERFFTVCTADSDPMEEQTEAS